MQKTKLSKILSEQVDLGIDLDTKNQFQLLKTYFNAVWIAKHINEKAEVRVYETNHGYHIRVYGVKTNVYHRLGLGDDKDRVYLGEKRCNFDGTANDILFTHKFRKVNGKVIYESYEEEINVLSLPFWWGWYGGRNKEGRKGMYRRKRV